MKSLKERDVLNAFVYMTQKFESE